MEGGESRKGDEEWDGKGEGYKLSVLTFDSNSCRYMYSLITHCGCTPVLPSIRCSRLRY